MSIERLRTIGTVANASVGEVVGGGSRISADILLDTPLSDAEADEMKANGVGRVEGFAYPVSLWNIAVGADKIMVNVASGDPHDRWESSEEAWRIAREINGKRLIG
jgi:hypothetical protein